MGVRTDDALLNGKGWDITPRGSLNLSRGGQFAYVPNLGELVNSQRYVQRNMVVLAVDAPRVFTLLPDADLWISSWKALIEKHAFSVKGFKQGLELVTTEVEVGGSGEKKMEITDSKRARTEPVLSFYELEMRPIQRFISWMIRYAGMDPDTKTALIATLVDEANLPQDWLFDWYGGTIIAYETDITNRFVDKAWLTTDFWFTETGAIEGQRSITENKDVLQLEIKCSGVSRSDYSVVMAAQSIHNKIRKTDASPGNMQAFYTELQPLVNEIKNGYVQSVEDISNKPLAAGRPT